MGCCGRERVLWPARLWLPSAGSSAHRLHDLHNLRTTAGGTLHKVRGAATLDDVQNLCTTASTLHKLCGEAGAVFELCGAAGVQCEGHRASLQQLSVIVLHLQVIGPFGKEE